MTRWSELDDDDASLADALNAAYAPSDEADRQRLDELAAAATSAEDAATRADLEAAWRPGELDPEVHEELLRLALDASDNGALEEALAAAWRPTDLSEAVHEALLSAALDDPMAEPSREERRAASELRDALANRTDHPDVALAEALRSAAAPQPVSELVSARAARAAIDSGSATSAGGGKRSRVVVAFIGSALAAAAAFAIAVNIPRGPTPTGPTAAQPDLAQARSASELFSQKFERHQTSSRVDRIARARARDLRANRYAAWGVKP